MRRSGFSLLEVLFAAAIMATVLLGMVAFQTATLKVNSKEKDRAFAVQKAVQMMEEILAYQVTAGTAGTENIDSLAQASTDYSFKLTIDPKVTDVASPLSGNKPDKDGFRFVRQIRVVPVANEKGARRVTVAVFSSDGSNTPRALEADKPLALMTNIVKAAAVKTQPTQVYDMYLIDIENVPGWWSDPNTLREILANTIDFLESNNPGLDIRTHWIRRLAYGRDTYYKPQSNLAQPANNTAAVPFDQVYFYPGKLTATSMLYNPDVLRGQLRVDGVDKRPLSIGNTRMDLNEYQSPYAYADEFNHAMRYPQEEAKYNRALTAANNVNPPEMSLRMLLEKMANNELKNAIIVNLHAELIPVVPMRNYSDPARVPRYLGQSSTIEAMWGVDANDAEIDQGSRARLVTHPRTLEGNTYSWLEYRMYPFKSSQHGTEPVGDYQKARMVFRDIKDDLVDWNSSGREKDVVIDVMHRDAAGYSWQRIWPDNVMGYNASLRNRYLEPGPPIEFVSSTNNNEDRYRNDMIIRFREVPYTHTQVSGTSEGLNQLLHGFNYFPDPSLPDLSTPWAVAAGQPRNTARFRVYFQSERARRVDVLTTIGSSENFAEHQYPNRSETYQWVGMNPPVSEQFQIVGDPRLNPYADTRADGKYNRYFHDFSANNAYVNGGTSGWNSFPAAGSYYVQNVDLPRYFDFWREAMLDANGLFLNPAGWSFYYYGMGGEIYSNTSSMPFTGSTSYAFQDDIIGNNRGIAKVDNTWAAVPSLGSLYPDEEWDSWRQYGNLPSATYRRKEFSAMPSWVPGGSNPDFNKRMASYGCASFFNGGDAGNDSNVFNHLGRTEQSILTANGQKVANSFKMYLDSEYPSLRPFVLNTGGFPPDWTASAGSRTQLEWGLLSGPAGYYEQAGNPAELAVAPIVMKRGGRSAYFVMSSAAPAGDSGTTTLARLSVAASLQALFDMAAPSYRGGGPRLDQAVKLVPRTSISAPAEDSQLTDDEVRITWNLEWARWNTEPYSDHFANYSTNTYKPAMVYNLKFSTDGGTSWKFLNSPTTVAYAGKYDPTRAITNLYYDWDYDRWPNKEYLVRLEAYRAAAGYRETHYAFHQVAYTIAN